MTFDILFAPEVEDDLIGVYRWYEEKSSGLGEDFLRVFYSSASEISRTPLFYRQVYEDFRRCLLRRFPYAVYFKIREEEIIVYGVFHCARDPKTISSKIKERGQDT